MNTTAAVASTLASVVSYTGAAAAQHRSFRAEFYERPNARGDHPGPLRQQRRGAGSRSPAAGSP